MKADTRLFGEIDIEEQKIIHMENGMIGFPDLKKFALIYDVEKKKKESSIMRFLCRKINTEMYFSYSGSQ